jgi:hypothetical protein
MAACWIEEVWKMRLSGLLDADRKEYLRSFGVDPTYLGIRDYDFAQIRSATEEFEWCLGELTKDFEELYKDLNIVSEDRSREPSS